MTKVSPSLLSADFGRLNQDVEMVNRSEAALLHLDVMDGRFVPNISFGFPVIEAVSRVSVKPLDVHLMIVEPDRWVSRVRDTGAAIMNVHAEACTHLHRTVQAIRAAGMKAAVTLNPATPVGCLEEIVADLDMVLLMSVNPGFGGQKFIERTVEKTRKLKKLIADSGSHAEIEIDGGVNLETGRRLVEAGADILVAGSYVFGAEDPEAVIAGLAAL
ncbi:ribulose-phosphate 3-epimerase [Muribaculaceae bacterium]|jgi:ribulose-phosphate 3-epimerase|uniref:ribulose-phosphate 3-epimerase n=1 Tax=Duncaniella muris TaxID=2094150 RepID=UPI001434F20B|nr:ribulose-phosphate 3-epimerase [Duncaniella muris]MCX4259704.1 ribulose-phosphate 3-epimerase [Muribaculaceae bacterium]GFI05486.1 ribulose-phosphate 3-epimerase [Muribaculaceae bacterium]